MFCGCFKKGNDNLLDDFKKKVTKSDNYYLSGELEIMNNEDVYSYIVEVAYKKDEHSLSYLYKISEDVWFMMIDCNGYEWKDNKWKKTLKGLFYYIF